MCRVELYCTVVDKNAYTIGAIQIQSTPTCHPGASLTYYANDKHDGVSRIYFIFKIYMYIAHRRRNIHVTNNYEAMCL